MYGRVPFEVLTDKRLNGTDVRIYGIMAMLSNYKTGKLSASAAEIAEHAGCSPDRVMRSRRALDRLGYTTTKSVPGKASICIVHPPTLGETTQGTSDPRSNHPGTLGETTQGAGSNHPGYPLYRVSSEISQRATRETPLGEVQIKDLAPILVNRFGVGTESWLVDGWVRQGQDISGVWRRIRSDGWTLGDFEAAVKAVDFEKPSRPWVIAKIERELYALRETKTDTRSTRGEEIWAEMLRVKAEDPQSSRLAELQREYEEVTK